MNLIEFIKEYADRRNEFTRITLEFNWKDSGIDEDLCFEGKPSEFVERYTRDYDCLEGMDLLDVYKLNITNDGSNSQICIEIWRD